MTAHRLFGGWNNLLLAAGLPLNMDRREETQREVERMHAAGRSIAEIADHFGWTAEAVYQRLKNPARLRLVTEQPTLRERAEHARTPRDPVHSPVTRLRTVNGTQPETAGCHTNNCRCGLNPAA